MIVAYGTNSIDISILTMQLIMKVTYAAWSINDLAKSQAKVKEQKVDNEGSTSKLISRYPSLLEYMGYSFSFVGIVGPATNLEDYLDFIDETVRANYFNFSRKIIRTSRQTGKLI